MQVALSYVVGTRSKNRQSTFCVVSTHGEVELHVIGMPVNTMVCGDIYQAAVDGEQQRPEDRSPRNTDLMQTTHTQLKNWVRPSRYDWNQASAVFL